MVGLAVGVIKLPFPTPDKVAPLNNTKVPSVIAFQINIPALEPKVLPVFGKGLIRKLLAEPIPTLTIS